MFPQLKTFSHSHNQGDKAATQGCSWYSQSTYFHPYFCAPHTFLHKHLELSPCSMFPLLKIFFCPISHIKSHPFLKIQVNSLLFVKPSSISPYPHLSRNPIFLIFASLGKCLSPLGHYNLYLLYFTMNHNFLECVICDRYVSISLLGATTCLAQNRCSLNEWTNRNIISSLKWVRRCFFSFLDDS